MEELDRRLLLGAAGLAGVAALARSGHAGPLNPPGGAVAGTGRTLGEVYDKVARTPQGFAEARTPVQSLAGNSAIMHIISQPGSYYLTGDLLAPATNMLPIFVQASDVTLDLNGFTVSTPAGSTRACIEGQSRLRIFNGSAQAGGSAGNLAVSVNDDCLLSGLHITGGLQTVAIGLRARVHGCTVISPLTNGFCMTAGGGSEVIGCRFVGGGTGVQVPAGRISDCIASGCATGFSLFDRAVAERCSALDCTNIGFRLGDRCGVRACVAHNAGTAGILVSSGGGCEITGCRATSCGIGTSGAGIRIAVPVTGSNQSNYIADNHMTGNWRNLDVLTSTNVVVRNYAAYEQGGGNFALAAGNTHGPIVFAGQQNLANVANANHPQVNISY